MVVDGGGGRSEGARGVCLEFLSFWRGLCLRCFFLLFGFGSLMVGGGFGRLCPLVWTGVHCRGRHGAQS